MIVGLACEDEGHFTAVTRLVDDTLLASHSWLDGIIDDCRTWRGLTTEQRWYKYHPDDARDLRPVVIDGVRIPMSGHIGGEPLKPEAGMWRRALLLFTHSDPRPDVVVLVRDLDGYPERLAGIEQVRRNIPWPFAVVVAAPQPEIEAWFVSGFIPEDATEQARLDELCRALSFDPTKNSERLTSHPNDVPRDAKRVFERLCDGERLRAARCLEDRERLRQRGALNGAADFLDEVETRIVPVLGHA